MNVREICSSFSWVFWSGTPYNISTGWKSCQWIDRTPSKGQHWDESWRTSQVSFVFIWNKVEDYFHKIPTYKTPSLFYECFTLFIRQYKKRSSFLWKFFIMICQSFWIYPVGILLLLSALTEWKIYDVKRLYKNQ